MDEVTVYGWIQVFVSVVLAFLTGVLAFVANKNRKAQTQPVVVVSAKSWEGPIHVQIIIENVGSGPAYDVEVFPEQPIHSEMQGSRKRSIHGIDDYKFLRQPLLKPGDRVRFLLGEIRNIEPKTFSFNVRVIDIFGERHKLVSTIDLDAMLETLPNYDKHVKNIDKNIENISNNINKIGKLLENRQK